MADHAAPLLDFLLWSAGMTALYVVLVAVLLFLLSMLKR